MHVLNLGVEAKLRALIDHIAALKVNKAWKQIQMDSRIRLMIKRVDIVGGVLRAFGQMGAPSLFRQTDVKFIGESGIDRGGLTAEMLCDFWSTLVPSSSESTVHSVVEQEEDHPPLFEVADPAEPSHASSSGYWLPRRGLHKWGMGHLEKVEACGKVLAKCLMELIAIPSSFPPLLFAALAYGGEDESLIHDLIPSCEQGYCAQQQQQHGDLQATASTTTCPVHSALAYLKPFDAQACDSLSNLIEHPIDPSLGLTVGDILGDAPVLQPTREQLAERLKKAVELDAVTDEEEKDDNDASDDENDNDSAAEEAAVEAAAKLADEPLTDANKARCVIRVVSYRLLESRLPEIVALRRGFHTIKWSGLVALFTGDELQTVMCGVMFLEAQELWDALGFESSVKADLKEWLKSIIFESGMAWRKKLLRFITGSFTLPRGGLQRKLMVRNQGGESAVELLPRASTCTDSLYLPRYASREELERKLTIAIDNTAGFWLW